MPLRGFARDMLAIKDHLDRALAAVSDELRADKTASQFLAGIEATSRELDAVFQRARGHSHQVGRRAARPAPPSGDDRDAERPGEPGTIVEEMQPGYMMKDRLLRPALVGVAKKPA